MCSARYAVLCIQAHYTLTPSHLLRPPTVYTLHKTSLMPIVLRLQVPVGSIFNSIMSLVIDRLRTRAYSTKSYASISMYRRRKYLDDNSAFDTYLAGGGKSYVNLSKYDTILDRAFLQSLICFRSLSTLLRMKADLKPSLQF